MAETVRQRYPHLEDSQNIVMVDADTNKRVWVNLTKVFKIESVESGGMFGFRFFSVDFAVDTSMEQHFFTCDSALVYNTVEELTAAAKLIFWNFPGSIGVLGP